MVFANCFKYSRSRSCWKFLINAQTSPNAFIFYEYVSNGAGAVAGA